MNRVKIVAAVVVMLAVGTGVGRAQGGQGDAGMADFMKAMGAIMSGGTGAPPAVVDFRELKALLPASLPGMKRTDARGEKSSAVGMTVATAQGSYTGGDDSTIQITITDNGGLGGFMAMAQAGWAASEIDSETETGFERTAMYGSHKAHEEYDNSNKSGKVEILVGGRFMVETEGNGVAFDALQAAAKQVDLNKLASLKPAAAPAK